VTQRPLDESKDPSKASDPQKIALYIANLLLAKNALGNVSIGAADQPVIDGDFAAFKGPTGKKIHDTGYSPASFDAAGAAAAALAAAEAYTDAAIAALQTTLDLQYQRSERRVLAGATRTVRAWTSDTIVGPFSVEDTGTLVIEDEGVLLIH